MFPFSGGSWNKQKPFTVKVAPQHCRDLFPRLGEMHFDTVTTAVSLMLIQPLMTMCSHLVCADCHICTIVSGGSCSNTVDRA